MGSGTCRCCNSTVNDTVLRVHFMGVNCKMLLTVCLTQERHRQAIPRIGQVLRHRQEAGESFWRNNCKTARCSPAFSPSLLFPAAASQPWWRNCGSCMPVGTTWGKAGRCLHAGLSGGKSCSWFTMLAQFHQGTYMDQGFASSSVYHKFFPVIHCYSSTYPNNMQGLLSQEGWGTKQASWGASSSWGRSYCGEGRSPGCSTGADGSSAMAPSPRL